MLAVWRKQFANADQVDVRRGPKVNPATAHKRRDQQLNREIARLIRQLARVTVIIEAQKNEHLARTTDRGTGVDGLMALFVELRSQIGIAPAYVAFSINRAEIY
jgi:hypothetical protein